MPAIRKKSTSHSYIEQRKGVCGGRPVIKETRFPVSSIAIQYQRGLSAEDILRDYPQLSPPQVYGALAYYFDHQTEVEAEVARIRHRERQMSRDPALRLFRNDKTHSVSGP